MSHRQSRHLDREPSEYNSRSRCARTLFRNRSRRLISGLTFPKRSPRLQPVSPRLAAVRLAPSSQRIDCF